MVLEWFINDLVVVEMVDFGGEKFEFGYRIFILISQSHTYNSRNMLIDTAVCLRVRTRENGYNFEARSQLNT